MITITIPKNLIKNDDLVIIPRKKYEKLLTKQKVTKVTEEDVLCWAKEAKILRKMSKLPKLRSWKDFEK